MFFYENNAGEGYIEIPLLYYPIYHAQDENKQEIELTLGEFNTIRILLNEKKSGEVIVSAQDRGWFVACDWISILTFAMLLFFGTGPKNKFAISKKIM